MVLFYFVLEPLGTPDTLHKGTSLWNNFYDGKSRFEDKICFQFLSCCEALNDLYLT